MNRLAKMAVIFVVGLLFTAFALLRTTNTAVGSRPYCTPTPSQGCSCSDFSVEMQVDAPTHQVGDIIEYRVEVDKASGCTSSKYVTFDVYWTSNVSYVSYTSGWSCSVYGNHLHCGRNDYDWGGSYTYIRMRANAPGDATLDVRNFQVEADYIDSSGTPCPYLTASATTNITQPTPTPTPTATPTPTLTPTPTVVPATVGDWVWFDTNMNGLQDSGEVGVSDVTVQLFNNSSCSGSPVRTTNTASDGSYSFTGLTPGTYSIAFLPPAGYALSPANQGTDDAVDSDADPTTGCTGAILLGPGDTDVRWDAGLYGTGRIGDRVWSDTDGDGVQDAGETQGIYDVPLHVTGQDELGHTVDITVTSSITGFYSVEHLAPGTYTVTAPATVSGFVRTSPSPQTTTLNDGHMVDLTLDFGYIAPTMVRLMAFTTHVSPSFVRLTWKVRAEEGASVRFRVWRALVQGATESISPWLDPQKQEGAAAVYSFTDAAVKSRGMYFYWLEDEYNQTFGPWKVDVPAGDASHAYVPLIVHR